jgi:uncharacterized protein YceK
MTNRLATSKARYTPGPYAFYRDHSGCEEYLLIVDVARESMLACIILPWDCSPAELEQAKSNARLFAAAPELLEALESLLAAGCPSEHEQYNAAVSKAVAIIAEVLGETVTRASGRPMKTKDERTSAEGVSAVSTSEDRHE